jgi:actin-related protein
LKQLPDGRVIKVGAERFQAPEALFTPVSIIMWIRYYTSSVSWSL